MKRFSFRLESVLRVRRFELDRARTELARLETERQRRQDVVRNEAACVVEGQTLLAAEADQGADGERIAMRADAVTAGRYRLARAERAVEDLAGSLTEARRRVHHARARVRSLERLEEEAAAAHERAERAAEQAELEELAMARIALERVAARRTAALAAEEDNR